MNPSNQNYLVVSLFIVVSLLTPCKSIMFKLVKSQPTCLKIKGPNTYIINYIVSGEKSENTRVQIYDDDRFVTKNENSNEGSFTLEFFSLEGKVCFERTDNKEKSISFDCYAERDPTREIIDKKEVSTTLKSLSNAVNSLLDVDRNQRYHI